MEIRHLTDEDVPEAARVFERALGVPPRNEPARARAYWDVEDSFGAFDGDRLLGIATTFASRFVVPGGATVDLAAVPQVGVRPDSHGRGVGRALLEEQVRWAAGERGAAALALNSSEVPIYGRYGYGPTSDWWGVEADPRMLRWRDDAPADPGGIEELDLADARQIVPAAYARWFGRWHGEVERHDGWWASRFLSRKGEDEPMVAVHRDAAGEIDAFCFHTVKLALDGVGFANRLDVQELVGATDHAEAVLARWLLSRNLVGKVTAERWNPRSAVPWMLEEPRRLRTTERNDAVWLRILDVPRVLGARTSAARGRVVVRVHDPLVAVNDRAWSIEGADGRLHVAATDEEPAVELGVELLASLSTGWVTASRLAAAGRLTVRDPAGAVVLDELLATARPAWCSTGF